MLLRSLNAFFLGDYRESPESYRIMDSIKGAQGLFFQCPKCSAGKIKSNDEETGRPYYINAHGILCWFTNPVGADFVPQTVSPNPGQWLINGSSLDDLSFIGPENSTIYASGECRWSGHLVRGSIH